MNRLTLLNVIERVRKHVVCAYVGDICDCKYGAQDLPELNENRLNLADARARKYLAQQMESFLFDDVNVEAQGYVPPAQ